MNKSLQQCFEAIDSVNAKDPEHENYNDGAIAKALLYGQRMSACQKQYFDDASDLLCIAVRAQHLERWAITRDQYEKTRSGYLLWRKALAKHHADRCTTIMQQQGYSGIDCATVADLLQKKNLKTNPETQCLEDIACLVFLQHYFDDFSARHNEDKIIRIVQKTWAKMSAQGHSIALQLALSDNSSELINKALQ